MYQIKYLIGTPDQFHYASVAAALDAVGQRFPKCVFTKDSEGTWVWKDEVNSTDIDRNLAVAYIEWKPLW